MEGFAVSGSPDGKDTQEPENNAAGKGTFDAFLGGPEPARRPQVCENSAVSRTGALVQDFRPTTNHGCPTSLVFGDMWDSTALTPKLFTPNQQLRSSRRKAIEESHFRPTYAGANVGHPCRVVGTAAGLRGRPSVSHISRKTSEMPRISCTQLWTGPRVRLS
jgi:hypothetical protein